MTLSEQYARFVHELNWTRLPTEVRQIALELFADWFANAAAGLTSPLSQALLSLAPIYDGPGRALRVGDLEPVEPLWAALVNAGASHALEFDDSYRAGLYHPGAPTLSAAFSGACRAEVPGAGTIDRPRGRVRGLPAPGFGRQPGPLQILAHHRNRGRLRRRGRRRAAPSASIPGKPPAPSDSPAPRPRDFGRFFRMPRKPRTSIPPRPPTPVCWRPCCPRKGSRGL